MMSGKHAMDAAPRRALITDDSRFLRERLKQLLALGGWHFTEAENGSEALRALQEQGPFDLLLLDWNMPVMDGLECVRTLRQTGIAPATKVMMVTTEADASFIAEALDCGADEFLMKPFTPDNLQAKLLILGLGDAVGPPF